MPTLDELYNTLGAVVEEVTGRKWWRKDAVQGAPAGPHALLFLTESEGLEKDVVETIEYEEPLVTGESFKQIPWGTARIACQIEFIRSGKNDTARDAAMRMKQGLNLEARFYDLWKIAAPSGTIRFIDISGMFREDIDPHTRLDFSLMSNISVPEPLTGTDIHEIERFDINVTEIAVDGETEVTEVISIDSTN